MLDQSFCGIITKIGDTKIDQKGDTFREIVFQEVNKNIFFNGRKISLRMFNCYELNIYDMIFCQKFRIFNEKAKMNQIRLERNSINSYEYVGYEECKIMCDEEILQRMKNLQMVKKGQ